MSSTQAGELIQNLMDGSPALSGIPTQMLERLKFLVKRVANPYQIETSQDASKREAFSTLFANLALGVGAGAGMAVIGPFGALAGLATQHMYKKIVLELKDRRREKGKEITATVGSVEKARAAGAKAGSVPMSSFINDPTGMNATQIDRFLKIAGRADSRADLISAIGHGLTFGATKYVQNTYQKLPRPERFDPSKGISRKNAKALARVSLHMGGSVVEGVAKSVSNLASPVIKTLKMLPDYDFAKDKTKTGVKEVDATLNLFKTPFIRARQALMGVNTFIKKLSLQPAGKNAGAKIETPAMAAA